MMALALSASCEPLDDDLALPALDEHAFHCEVEPVLVARCAFYACHGSGARPLRIYALNRLRLDPARGEGDSFLDQPLTPAELRSNFSLALGFVDPDDPPASLLLQKPLDVDAGGAYHGGDTRYGNVFRDRDDAGYRAIESWIEGGTRKPGCTPRTEVGL